MYFAGGNTQNDAGDFAAVLYGVASTRSSVSSTALSVKAINDHLDAIAAANATKGKKELKK